MRYIFLPALIFAYTSIVRGSGADGDELEAGKEAVGGKRTSGQDIGCRIRRLSIRDNPSVVSDPMEAAPSLLSGAVVAGTDSMPPPDMRYSTPPRQRSVAIDQGSPPEGARINLDSASSSPVSAPRGPPTTPPRIHRAISAALENTPDRPSLYG